MGVRLITEVLDHSPEGLTPSERLALIALAERAADDTRTAWPTHTELSRRLRISERSVRRVLAGLVERGHLHRLGGGYRGRAVEYRFPAKQDTATSAIPDEKAGHSYVRHSGEKGGHPASERRTSRGQKADTAMSSQPSVPSDNPQIRARERTAVVDALRARTGKTIDESHADKIITQLLDGRSVRDRCRYLAAAIGKDNDPARFLPTPGPPRYHRQQPDWRRYCEQ